MAVSEKCFGEIKDGAGRNRKATEYKLSNENLELSVINYGAAITSLRIPDKNRKWDDVVFGFDDLSGYLTHPYYFGCTVGRFANRIANGSFKLKGKTYNLALNNGPNHLHGGVKGFDKVIWESEAKSNQVTLNYTSPSMEENYPGELKCRVVYEITADGVHISYHATTSQPTPINLTNHSYFNLAGHGSGNILDQIISIDADHYLPVDDTQIPTGVVKSVDSTNFDLREPKSFRILLSTQRDGYDHTFCVNGNFGEERHFARVYDPKSGRCMEVRSTQPGVQLYTANFLPEDESVRGKQGKYYKKQGAFCLETQNYPDSVNQENFPKGYIDVDEVYNHSTKLLFSVK